MKLGHFNRLGSVRICYMSKKEIVWLMSIIMAVINYPKTMHIIICFTPRPFPQSQDRYETQRSRPQPPL